MSYTDHKTSEAMLSRDKKRNSFLTFDFNFKQIFLLLTILVSITAGGQFAWSAAIGSCESQCNDKYAQNVEGECFDSWELVARENGTDGYQEYQSCYQYYKNLYTKCVDDCRGKVEDAKLGYDMKGDGSKNYVPTTTKLI